MIDQTVCERLNDQIRDEFYASYLYLSMAAYFEDANLSGFAAWMQAQSLEEHNHAMRIYDFIHDRGGRVRLQQIDAPPADWDSPLEAFKAALEHEQNVTSKIHSLVDLSLEKRDHATNTFLDWFVNEQVEEEATADDLVNKLALVGDSGNGLFMLDRDLGQRSAPAPAEGE